MLLIQYALNDSQKICKPDTAPKGEKYYCPGCGEEVILRRGEVKVAHFAHKSGTNCTQESILHKTAKKLIIEVITNYRDRVRIQRHCAICGVEHYQPLPADIISALPEIRLESGFIADVGLLDSSKTRAAVEVHVTHFVDERKESEIGIPFIEVEGSDIAEDAMNLKPIKDNLKDFICPDCRNGLPEYLEKCKEVADLYGISLPQSHFRYAVTSCWKCHAPLIVFAWEDVPDPSDLPKTLQRTKPDPFGNEWANICPKCNRKQGHYFLHMEPDSPFFGLDLTYTNDSFAIDMMRIAHASKQSFEGRDGFAIDEEFEEEAGAPIKNHALIQNENEQGQPPLNEPQKDRRLSWEDLGFKSMDTDES